VLLIHWHTEGLRMRFLKCCCSCSASRLICVAAGCRSSQFLNTIRLSPTVSTPTQPTTLD